VSEELRQYDITGNVKRSKLSERTYREVEIAT